MKILTILLTAAILLCANSCKLLRIQEAAAPSDVVVCTDWTQLGGNPEGATIVFYPELGDGSYSFRTNSVENVHVLMPEGYYTVLVFNRTEEEFSSMSFSGMERSATTRCTLVEELYPWIGRSVEAGRTVCEPEEIVAGRTDHFHVWEVSEEAPGTDSVFVSPKRMVLESTVRIRVQGVQNVRSARSYLTGMAGGAFLSTREASDTLATIVPESWTVSHETADHTRGWLTAKFRCFGLPEKALRNPHERSNRLYLELLLVDGSTKMTYSFDVGDRCEENREEFTFNITIGQNATPADTAIVIPDVKPENGGESGFRVGIDDWDDPEDKEVFI